VTRDFRTAPRTDADARARFQAALSHLEISEVILADTANPQYATVAASLAVLAGIAAADALTCRRMRVMHRGQDHRDAADLLEQAIPDGSRMAAVLRRLLDLKGSSHYGVSPVGRRKATDAVRWARTLVDRAREELES